MISISKKIKFLLLALCLVPSFALAQQSAVSQTLSVSPTLFEMQANPGQAWTSSVRVINVNDYTLTVYPQPVNFAPLGEDGRGDLIPIFSEETQGQTLAEWITVPSEPVVIPPQATAEVPLQVNVPNDAAPGGHYAAILIGTKPPTDESSLSQVQTAQFVTALFFVRVSGDVKEMGNIREFTTNKNIVQTPTITLDMRFENTGNVHIQPQGDIKVFNMWGKERGVIPINHQTHFGNVLPNSIRKFSFTWTGDTSLYDIGRYKAIATLGYGDASKQFVTSTTYFWVIPYTTILITLFVLFVTLKLGLWLIRRYIDRMLALSGVPVGEGPYVPLHARTAGKTDRTVVIKRYDQVTAPVKVSYREVVDSWRASIGFGEKTQAIYRFAARHAKIIFALVAIFIVLTVAATALYGIFKDRSHYEVSINNPGADIVMSSEDIAYEELRLTKSFPEARQGVPEIRVENVSGAIGAGAAARVALEESGYPVVSLTVDASRDDDRTIIVFPSGQEEVALQLSRLLTGALLSARDSGEDTGIVIYAGKDSLPR
jgi:phage pi2 protein 07